MSMFGIGMVMVGLELCYATASPDEILEQAFEAAGYSSLRIGDTPFRRHITVANNRGGDPFPMFSDPHRYLKQQRNLE